jgi:hypothetical protein
MSTGTVTLAELTGRTGREVLDHLARDIEIPVIAGLQAQGDLIVIPHELIRDHVAAYQHASWRPVPASGIAPGCYVIRRQRESSGLSGRVVLVAD